MDVFLTGASGYIGGSVAVRLVREGHRVRGLVRSVAKAEAIRRLGVEAVIGNLGDDARGEPSDRVFDENTPIEPTPDKAPRVAFDRLVLDASARGMRSIVLCNSLIYGTGLGPHEESIQIPDLVRQARASGVARHVGRGLNVWSTVHIEDVADLYLLSLERAEPGAP